MPQPLFSIPLDAHSLAAFSNPDPRDTTLVAEKGELLRSPNHGAVDAAAERLDIFIEYKDFRTRFPHITKHQLLTIAKRFSPRVVVPPVVNTCILGKWGHQTETVPPHGLMNAVEKSGSSSAAWSVFTCHYKE